MIYFRRLSGKTGRQRDRQRDAVPRQAGAPWELSDEIERASEKSPTSEIPPPPTGSDLAVCVCGHWQLCTRPPSLHLSGSHEALVPSYGGGCASPRLVRQLISALSSRLA